MAKFNKTTTRTAVISPVRTEAVPTGRTHEGGAGYTRDARSELFLLAVSNMVGEQTFYESAISRDSSYRELIRAAAVGDPDWTARFLAWLRIGANLRSAALVGALEAAKAMRDNNIPGGRRIVDSVLQRADEPGEALAYWTANYGRSVPKSVKRGIADAARRLYHQRALLKYDTASKGFRFGDVLELTHPVPAADKPWQGDLFSHAIDRRHGRGETAPPALRMLAANRRLRDEAAADPSVLCDAERLRDAGMTWEDALSLAGSGADTARLWEALIPSMGYMALLRNLRNFDQAGVSDTVASRVAARLSDPEEVARSRQLPMRFLSAYRAAPSLRWAYPLETALAHSLSHIPDLAGRTLILIDTSGSMDNPFSKNSSLMLWDAAALFGIALGRRCETAEVVSFSKSGKWDDHIFELSKAFPDEPGESVLKSLERWKNGGYFIGGGTHTRAAVAKHYDGHDRVVIVTDEQACYDGDRDVTAAVPEDKPVYTWNLAGYQYGHAPSGTGTRHTFGGLSDQAFAMIPLLEAGRNADWPF